MPASNNMVKTEYANVRKREMANGDVGFYIRQGSSFKLVGLQSQGVTALEAHKRLHGLVSQTDEVIEVAHEFTLDDVFARFKHIVTSNPNATKNHKDYVARYETHIAQKFGPMPLTAITASEVGLFYHNTKAEYSEGQAYHLCNVIRYLYGRAREWGMYVGPTPMGKGTSFILPMPQRKREEVYESEDIRAILDQLSRRSKTLHDMVKLAYLTGLRRGELFNLQACHVNLRTGETKIVDPKGKRDTYIFMPPSALEIIRERSTDDPQAYIFPTEKGTKMKYLSKTFKRVLKELGINEGVTDSRFKRGFHSIRHTFATEVLASGDVTIVDLQHMLGHKNVTTTQRYTHPAKKAMVAAANYMEKRLGE